MLRSYLVVAGSAVTALALAASVNCGGSTETHSTGGQGTGGGGTTTTTPGTGGSMPMGSKQPPGPPAMMAGDGPTSVTFAVSKLYLGDTDPDGTPDMNNGWKHYGYDLDGKQSTATSTDLCKPRNGATPKAVYPDGDLGTDNSFGKNILPLIIGLSSGAPQQINDSIAAGTFTLMLDMEKLGSGANYNPLTTQLYAGADLGHAPAFDGTDVWPVRPELLNDSTDITKGSKVNFPMSYVNNNTWVSGSKGDVNLSLSIQGFTLNLTISNAVITMDIDAAHMKGTKGIIAGILKTDVLISELQKVAGSFDPSFCDPNNPTFQGLAQEIAQASDILADGSQDPTKTCDGISVGLGFDASIVKLGTIAAPSTGNNPCSDGGTP